MNSLVSVCIPCRNAEAFIGSALDSVLSQTHKKIEIIVVNDGSTDGTLKLLDRYQVRGVKVLDERCGSAAKARNLAMSIAVGDYVKFFDADDLLHPQMIERQIERLKGSQSDVAFSGWGRFYNDDLTTFKLSPQSVWRDMSACDWLVESWIDARPMMQPGQFLIPRKVLDKVGGWDEQLTLIDDFEFYARTLCCSRCILFAQGAQLYYRSGVLGSLSGRKSREAAESAYNSLIRGTGHLLRVRNDARAMRSCANLLQDFIFGFYPAYADLIRAARLQVSRLGGSDLEPDGPPRFHSLRRIVGWKLARRIQHILGS